MPPLSDKQARLLLEITKDEWDARMSPESIARRNAMTTEQLKRLDRLQRAQMMVIEKADLWGTKDIWHGIVATQMAMSNDMDAPVEDIAADALRILGLTP